MKEYRGFQLDKFQEDSFQAWEDGLNILCCAPTGSGKTLIAEYIIEQSLKSGQQEVIYTAPIKALSNQKYRDFIELYGKENVGIITGDVVVNQMAPVILMTTEIYRNIIYDSPERLDHVKTVVFDEVHYIEDEKRGTVWEESLMLSPDHVRFLCLSATVANADQIAEWLANVRGVETKVVHHNIRPVPLRVGFFVDNVGYFKDRQLNRAIRATTSSNKNSKSSKKNYTAVDYLNQQKLLPVLYFCFSRKRCERMAHSYSNRQLTDAETSQKAVMWFEEYLETHGLAWSRSARELTETIASGVAWHHAGVLPPLKEAVEILFSRGWIRLLFATETFALGINMPARSVIFSSLEKNDGIAFRYLRAYEFQQMAGRAGRRGIDTEGDVVVNLEPKYARFEETRDTVFGLVEPLASRFAFSYSSLMNLYERHDMQEIHQLATHSLASYQQELSSERLEKSITKLKEEVENLVCSRSKGLAMERILVFHNLTEELQTCKDKMDSIRQTMRRKPMAEKQQYHGQLTDLSEKIVFIKKNLAKNRCKKCYDGSNCMSYIQRLKRLEKRRHKGGNRMLELIDRKFACLQELKFVNETGLLPRGEFARNIFGYEIQATELYFEGWLNTTDPLEILAVLATVTFEKRRDEDGRCRDRRYRNVVRKFIERIEQLKKIEYSILKIETIPLPDAGFVDPVLLWAAGADFEQLSVSFPDFAEGDMIRQFRQIIDLLRQLKRAMKNDEFTRDKLNTCTELINRDVVDAEQYL